jgi:hypothetical protein
MISDRQTSNLIFDYGKYHHQYEDITINSVEDINNLPELTIPKKMLKTELPPILYRLMANSVMNGKQNKIFMSKFGMSYLHYPKLREIVDGWVFLFLDCKYAGIFPTDADAIAEGHRLNYPGHKIHLSPMYLETIGGEYKETKSVSMGHIINSVNTEG